MNKYITSAIVSALRSNPDVAYEFYRDYCKAKGIYQELQTNDFDGINCLFDNPAMAVYAYANAELQPLGVDGVSWEFIYLDDNGVLKYCDDISEKIDLMPIVEWMFSLDEYDKHEWYSRLDEVDVVYNVCQNICKGKPTEMFDRFTSWLDDTDNYHLEYFINEDINAIKAKFFDTL